MMYTSEVRHSPDGAQEPQAAETLVLTTIGASKSARDAEGFESGCFASENLVTTTAPRNEDAKDLVPAETSPAASGAPEPSPRSQNAEENTATLLQDLADLANKKVAVKRKNAGAPTPSDPDAPTVRRSSRARKLKVDDDYETNLDHLEAMTATVPRVTPKEEKQQEAALPPHHSFPYTYAPAYAGPPSYLAQYSQFPQYAPHYSQYPPHPWQHPPQHPLPSHPYQTMAAPSRMYNPAAMPSMTTPPQQPYLSYDPQQPRYLYQGQEPLGPEQFGSKSGFPSMVGSQDVLSAKSLVEILSNALKAGQIGNGKANASEASPAHAMPVVPVMPTKHSVVSPPAPAPAPAPVNSQAPVPSVPGPSVPGRQAVVRQEGPDLSELARLIQMASSQDGSSV